LQKEGFKLTQATLSRDLKQLKVAKAASMSGNYVYVLPNETMYKRVSTPGNIREMMAESGFVSLNFSDKQQPYSIVAYKIYLVAR
jgi:transcriptional regulator of arginine metabolism